MLAYMLIFALMVLSTFQSLLSVYFARQSYVYLKDNLKIKKSKKKEEVTNED